ncbi:MAG: aromatic ring-hydroxylating dioxygenase subunit alpha, partial [Chloroflexota bacterium]
MSAFIRSTQSFVQGSRTLPRERFVSQENFEREQERIFARQWLCVGRAEQIPNAGDYFTYNIGTESLILVRDRENKVHAYFNVCRHRGTRICEEASGKLHGSIQCPYHAWTYDLQGNLIGAPNMGEAEDFRKEAYPLHRPALTEWEGFLFVNMSAASESFEQTHAPLIGKFDEWQIANLRSARRIEYQVRANWKLIVQNYSECNHCSLVHPELVKKSPPSSGHNDLTEGAFLGGYMELKHQVGSMTMSGRVAAEPILTVKGLDLDRVFYYSLFPNMLLSLHPDYVMYHTLTPLAPTATRVTCDWLFHPDASARADFNPNDAIEFWDVTNRQDWHVCEISQLGVQSRAYQPSPYAPNESLPA